MTECSSEGCSAPARAAIRVTRPKRDDMRVTLFADDRTAPKAASRHCKQHTLSAMQELGMVLIDGDEPDANE